MAPETFDQKEKISLRVTNETSNASEQIESDDSAGGSVIESATSSKTGASSTESFGSPGTESVAGSPNNESLESPNSEAAVTALPPESHPDFGGRFETLALIGEGGMGVVYKVKDPALDKNFAVKILRSNLAKDKQALKRFQREADALIKLNHPGLVAVYEQGVLGDGTPYIVMDFVDGENLADVIRANGKMDAQRAVKIFDQVMEAIEHVHHSSLVHRDVKPRNIILSKSEDGEEQIKLVDFGIAKEAGLDDGTIAGVTQTGDFLGSPFYMSPEQCQGAEPEHRSDIYSAGCVLYEMLTAKTPFASQNPVKVVVGHLSEKPVAPSTVLSEKSALLDELDHIVLKCLEKTPDRRYQTATGLREDLAACLANRSPHKDRQKSKRQTLGLTALGAVIMMFLITLSSISGAPSSFLWYAADFLTPHAPLLFVSSLAVFIALSLWMTKLRKTSMNLCNILLAPWLVSYGALFASYVLLPRVSMEPQSLIPYIAGFGASIVASVVFGLKYAALPKQIFFAPALEKSGRVLSPQENQQVAAWRKVLLSIFAAGAFLFKAPEFLPAAQLGPIIGPLLLMAVSLVFSHEVQKRVARPELTRPGDRWLMFAGVAGSVAALGHALTGVVSWLTEAFLITLTVSNMLNVLATTCTFAPLLISMVFLFVWYTRKQSITPFGKSDGW